MYWTKRKQELAALNKQAYDMLPEDKRPTVGKLDMFLIDEMIHKAGHTDVDYVRDLFQGFPTTGALQSGGCGEHIEGGQRVHGKPGLGGPDPISELQEMCGVRNQSTLKSAKARTPKTEEELILAQETWSKL